MSKNYDDCGLAKTLKVIGSKWSLPIIYQMISSPQRFSDLQRELKVSPRTLSLRLSELEEHDIISRRVLAEVPPHVQYSLTEKGRSLGKIIRSMSDWGERAKV